MGVIVCLLALWWIAGIVLAITRPKWSGKITFSFFAIAILGGLLLYGYSFSLLSDNVVSVGFHTIAAVGNLFLGNDSYESVAQLPFWENGWVVATLWLLLCYALYATASAVIAAFGTTLIRQLRQRLAVGKPLCIVYGLNDNSVCLGVKLLEERNSVVFVSEQTNADYAAQIQDAGGLVCTDKSAADANTRFLRNVGCRKQRETVLYALSADVSENIQYAQKLRSALEEKGVPADKLRLVIRAPEGVAINGLQVSAEQYGYGYVSAVDDAQLAARLLMREYPPCNTVSFDKDCKATEDFQALLIGFGHVGQAVLKQLIMSGQFEGSTFHATVFAPDCQALDGWIASQFDSATEQYDICINPYDARSLQMYQYLDEKHSGLKYTVISTGDDALDRELAEQLAIYFKKHAVRSPIYLCSRKGVAVCDSDGIVTENHILYQPELLSNTTLDAMAMVLNHRYQDAKTQKEKTPIQTWMECNYFNRQSCRAAADFTDAILRAAGETEENVRDNGWNLTPKQIENLSRTEHLRWCAFHYVMGFRVMDEETFQILAERYKRDVKLTGKSDVRLTKDMQKQLHGCLVSWEGLVDLAKKEQEVTGVLDDYQKKDTDNIMAIPELLRAMKN